MLQDVATPRTKKPVPPSPERRKSKLTEIGDEAMRRALLEALVVHDWSPARVAEALRMNGAANVLRAIKMLGLSDDYEKARTALGLKPGPRPGSV